jgi:hypothetical protein
VGNFPESGCKRSLAPLGRGPGRGGPIDATQYRAFLSYSHKDTALAEKWHTRLESLPIAANSIGQPGRYGPVPATLQPIFRGRLDYPASGALSALTLEALKNSAAPPDGVRHRRRNRASRSFAACSYFTPFVRKPAMPRPTTPPPIALHCAGTPPTLFSLTRNIDPSKEQIMNVTRTAPPNNTQPAARAR